MEKQTSVPNLLDRLPPQAHDEELALLSSLIVTHGERLPEISQILQPEHFGDDANQSVFTAILGLDDVGQPVDVVTLIGELKFRGQWERIGGGAYFTRMMASTGGSQAVAANQVYYARKVRQAADARRIIDTITAALVRAYEPASEATNQQIIDELLLKLEPLLATDAHMQREIAWTEGVHAALDRLDHPEHCETLPIGFTDLNSSLDGGLRRGQLVVVAGRPGMGKSVMAQQIGSALALDGRHVTMASCEMTPDDIYDRMLSQASKVPFGAVRRPHTLTTEQRQRITQRISYMHEHIRPYFRVLNAVGMTTERLGAYMRRVKAVKGCDVLVVDYLQRVGETHAKRSRQENVAHIARSLKNLALELNLAVVAACQLNRQTEGRNDQRPRLSDLRESGDIEQEADIVIGMFRPGYYSKDQQDADKAEAIVLKQRNGREGTVSLIWQSECVRFTNVQNEPQF